MSISSFRASAALKDRRVHLPNAAHQEYPEYGGRVTASMILKAAPDNLKAILFFGSAIRPRPAPRVVRKKFLFLQWRRVEQPDTPYANDVDVMYLVEGLVPKERTDNLELRHPESGSYGELYMVRHGFLHTAIVSEQELEDLAEQGDETALAVLREGVLLAGKTRVPLQSKRSFVADGDVYRMSGA